MNPFPYYVGLDVRRKSTSYYVLLPDGKLVRESKGGLEATICSHWIYWRLKP